jgi:hypothetical protein
VRLASAYPSRQALRATCRHEHDDRDEEDHQKREDVGLPRSGLHWMQKFSKLVSHDEIEFDRVAATKNFVVEEGM